MINYYQKQQLYVQMCRYVLNICQEQVFFRFFLCGRELRVNFEIENIEPDVLISPAPRLKRNATSLR